MRVYVLAILLLGAGCSSNGAVSDKADGGSSASGPDAGGPGPSGDGGQGAVDAATYADPSQWLCGAGAPKDYCLDTLTATSVLTDGTQAPASIPAASSPAVDCFYVYPSVDPTDAPGNIDVAANLSNILDPVREQAAPFRQVCTVFAPLYRQATYKSYFDANASTYLENAYADVAAAFHEYMAHHNAGRDFVLVGHSQGSHMLRRLIQRVIETSADVQKHLVVAILMGAFGDVLVPTGQAVGGTFKSTPLCTQDSQRGCVITFNSFAKGYEPTSIYGTGFGPVAAGMDVACTNPAALGGGKGALKGSLFFTQFQNPALSPPVNAGVSTTFAEYAGLFTGECLASSTGLSFFEIDFAPAAGDTRANPIPFASPYYAPSVLGLHLLDSAFPMGELLDAVRKRTGGGPTDAGAD
jgi:hypothetical protein